jgi:NADPH:quinone reductase-like Zn-dependent oxidoreductase
MKAVYIEQYGNSEQLVLGELDKPIISSQQVLIKVQASAVNPVDWMVREGFLKDMGIHKLPLVLGWDVSGEIEQVGSDVTDFSLGEAIFAYSPIEKQGAYAQYIAVDSQLIARKPKSLSAIESAAVPLAATTAWQALMQGCQLKAGDKVLIHNASGGVGSFAVQIAKAQGAYVIGTASAANENFVKELGVDLFIDYRNQRFEEVVKEMGEQVDCVFAAVGGDDVVTRSLSIIKKNGFLISLLDEIEEQQAQTLGIHYQRWWVQPNANDLQAIANLIDSGKIKVQINKVFPLDQVKAAHALSESQRARGKIVLTIDTFISED